MRIVTTRRLARYGRRQVDNPRLDMVKTWEPRLKLELATTITMPASPRHLEFNWMKPKAFPKEQYEQPRRKEESQATYEAQNNVGMVANSQQSEYRPVKPPKWTLPQGHIPYVCIRWSATLNEAYSSVQGLFLGAHPYRTRPSVPE